MKKRERSREKHGAPRMLTRINTDKLHSTDVELQIVPP